MPLYKTQRYQSNTIDDHEIFMKYRPDTTDPNAMKEVIVQRCYRRPKLGMDVESGEHWLDLGGNIGSFSAYCYLQGATAVAYEPEFGCFKLLKMNIGSLEGFEVINSAVTVHKDKTLQFYSGTKERDKYRYSAMPKKRFLWSGTLPNTYAPNVFKTKYDGVKMDIEGSELAMIDQGILPKCKKLVMEYHFSRDRSMANFRKRIAALRKHYKHVHYDKWMDKPMKDDLYSFFMDKFVYCFA